MVLFSLVQISPIKINPWSWLAKSLGKAVNSDVIAMLEGHAKRMGQIEAKLSEMAEKAEYDAAMAARQRILSFADEIGAGKVHSKEHYEDILENVNLYEEYCEQHKSYINNKAVLAVEVIKRKYEKLMTGGGFSG